MKLFLASFLHAQLGDFLGQKVAYIDDAAARLRNASFARAEREAVAKLCSEAIDVTVATTPVDAIRETLEHVDSVYVASGSTFDLLFALRSTGAEAVVKALVKEGLPYAGSSAGAIVAGPSIEPATIMDDPTTAPDLSDYRGLELTEHVVVPHAQGTTGPYTISVIARTVEEYGMRWPLVLLRDEQALVVDDSGAHLV